MDMLRTKLYDEEVRKAEEAISHKRKSLVSTGDRSAKIRTYNFPQGRVTDHRIGLTVYNLDTILNGDIQEFLDALQFAMTCVKRGLEGESLLVSVQVPRNVSPGETTKSKVPNELAITEPSPRATNVAVGPADPPPKRITSTVAPTKSVANEKLVTVPAWATAAKKQIRIHRIRFIAVLGPS